MDEFLGSWKLEFNEGLNEILTRLGAGYITRKTLNVSKPVLTFAREHGPGDPEVGEWYSLKTFSTLKSSTIVFRIGYTFDENTTDGRTVRTVFTVDGQVLKQEQKGTKTAYITYTREGDLLKTVIKVEDLTCFRNYRRVVQPPPANGTTPSVSTAKSSEQPTSPTSTEELDNTNSTK
ncbi:Fatty acid-binding -like protein 1 [Echinococcus granulosus]|nr:Fatty acid-binding -like protein 1 [Echinococcus granulosus]